jgi:murein DD-endopeptidase MepM/ murein hydrolase activator NlpD
MAELDASLLRDGRMAQPLRKEVVSSGFGMRLHPLLGVWRPHLGVDLAAPTGTPVYATADGRVSAAGRRGGYGLAITLQHARGMETLYGHMSRLNVARGQSVRRGEVIGWVGSTGLSTGPHLHYETRLQGRAVNPLPRVRAKKAR